MRFSRVAPLAFVAACSSTPTSTVDVVTGEETDTMTRAPAPTTLIVEEVDSSAKAKEIARTSLPNGSDISLGDVSTSDVASLRVTALDPAGKVLVKGETLLFQFAALQEASISVFVQRTGELARVPSAPKASLDGPVVDTVIGRYIVAASGTASLLYDLLQLQSLDAPTLPRAAKSMSTYGTVLLLVDENGATTFDLSTGQAGDLTTPTGGNYGEIAGGATVNAPDGSAYIVGGTRTTGAPSARVLRISADGNLTFASLATPRLGACATWVEGRGVVVIGGDDKGAGAEVLPATATVAAPLPFPPDASKGCGASTLDASHVAVVGGGSDARTLDLACTTNCQPAAWPGSVPLVRAQAITLAADAVLAVGDDATGATHAFRASATGAAEVALKVPRKNARVVPLPNGASAIVGGAPAIESYRD